jgi:hypothetical protein
MNFPEDHIERVKELGYTEAEARFLYIVAVHSGYFTLGQFCAFTGIGYGKRTASFAQKIVKRGHATVRDYMRKGSIFHLFSRTVYGQIDKDNLHNGKRHSFDFMRARLVLLDFILANQHLNYFETEQDKVGFFCDQLGIPKDCLPAKVYEGSPDSKPALRYFVDKFPMFVAPPFSGAPPVLTLSYVDSGFATSSHFIAHLAAYQGLFQQLDSFRFLYIAAKNAYFQRVEERFRALVKRPLESDASDEVLRYFQIRTKWERHQYVVPVTEDLEFLNQARRRFHGERFESLFQAWNTGKITERELRSQFLQLQPERSVFFGTFLVQPHGSPIDEVVRHSAGRVKDTHYDFRHRSRHPLSDRTSLPGEPRRSSLPRNRETLCSPCVLPAPGGAKKDQGEPMSIIHQPPEMVKREYELQEPIAVAVEKYAAFIESTPDHVVNSALEMVIGRDADFRRWRKQQTPDEKRDVHAAAKAVRA